MWHHLCGLNRVGCAVMLGRVLRRWRGCVLSVLRRGVEIVGPGWCLGVARVGNENHSLIMEGAIRAGSSRRWRISGWIVGGSNSAQQGILGLRRFVGSDLCWNVWFQAWNHGFAEYYIEGSPQICRSMTTPVLIPLGKIFRQAKNRVLICKPLV